ncbi:hypothetical protein GCM10009609_16230 [Pseudonocardia aurantiaca]|uniref:Uncharacterized protein n=1 Tax=Pseudonocardia aurantiaca TaxID=75290 RepID=A0ABW4FL86_9PSEU
MTVHNRWHGRVYKDFVVGDVYEHPLDRTITTTDNKRGHGPRAEMA